MSKFFKRFGLIMMALLMIFSSVSFMSLKTVKAADATDATANPMIRVGITKNASAIPLYMEETGHDFTKNNINVKLQMFNTTKELNDAMENDQVDAAMSDLSNYAAVAKINKSWKIASTAPGYDGLVAAKKYKTVKSLKGKKIAVNKNDGSKYYLSKLLKKNHVKMSAVKVKEIDSQDARTTALKNGEVDAAVLSDPMLHEAKVNGGKILNVQKTKADNGSVLLVKTAFYNKNMTAVATLVGTIGNAVKDINRSDSYMFSNDVLRNLKVSANAIGEMNDFKVSYAKPHKVKKGNFNKTFKYAKKQKLYKGKINYKKHYFKIKDVK